MAYTINNIISKSGCLMEAFDSAVVHDKSEALGMDNPAEIKTSSLRTLPPSRFNFFLFFSTPVYWKTPMK
jgi:hypothetical protein